jgi:hypothetical protein
MYHSLEQYITQQSTKADEMQQIAHATCNNHAARRASVPATTTQGPVSSVPAPCTTTPRLLAFRETHFFFFNSPCRGTPKNAREKIGKKTTGIFLSYFIKKFDMDCFRTFEFMAFLNSTC